MIKKKQLIAAAAMTAALAGGGIAGALLGTPSITSAQESQEETTTTEDAPEERRRGPGRGLEAAAEALGMTVEELRDVLDEDTSIADVAGERGVDVQAVIDAMVADATARIDEKVADGDLDAERAEEIKGNLVEHITAVVNGERPAFGGHRRGGPGHHHRGPGLEAAAEALGMTVEELREAVDEDTSIADVAAERGVDVQTVIDAMVAEATARIDEIKAGLPEQITAIVNGERPAFGGRGFGPGAGPGAGHGAAVAEEA